MRGGDREVKEMREGGEREVRARGAKDGREGDERRIQERYLRLIKDDCGADA